MSKGIMANSVLNAAAGLTMLVTGFVCSIVTARLLGPEANGIIAFAFWLTTTGTLIAGLGNDVILPRVLTQLRAQGVSEEDRRGFGAFFARGVLLVILVLLAVYAFIFYQSDRMHWAPATPSVAAVTGALFLVQSIGMLSINFMIGEQKLSTFFRLTLVSATLQIVVLVSGALTFGVSGALAGYVAGQAVFFVYALCLFSVKANPCGMGVKALAGTSVIISLQIIVESVFLNRIELLFLQQFQSVEIVGFYAIGLSLANLALQLPVQLTGSLVPYYTEQLHHRTDGKLPVELFETVIRSLAYFTLPMGLGLAAISWEMVTEVFGPSFDPAGSIVALLALSAPLSVFVQVGTKYLFAIDRERDRLLIGIAGAVVMVLGCLALVPVFGGEGAALTRIVMLAFMCVLMVKRMDFVGSMRPMFASLARIAIASAACAAAAYGAAGQVDGLMGIVCGIAAGALVYGVFLRLLKIIPATDIAVMSPMLDRLPGPLRNAGHRLLTMIAVPQAIADPAS